MLPVPACTCPMESQPTLLAKIVNNLYALMVGPSALTPKSVAFRTSTFTRPSDTNNYTTGDIVANSTTAATLNAITEASLAEGRGGVLQNLTLWKTGTGVTGAVFQVLFFSNPAAQIPANDNALDNVLIANAPFFLGSVNLPAMATGSGSANTGARTEYGQIALPYTCVGTTLYWTVKCLAAYTDEASAEQFTLGVGLLRD